MGDVFDEKTLRVELVRNWGDGGAHTEVLDHVVRRNADLQAEVERLRAELEEARRVAKWYAAEIRKLQKGLS